MTIPLRDRLRIALHRLPVERKPWRAFTLLPQYREAYAKRGTFPVPATPPSPDDPVVFLIAVIGKNLTKDWGEVNRLLRRTLRSLQLQTDPNWHALVCCQQRPDALPGDDARIVHVPFDTPEREGWYDRVPKQLTAASHLRDHGPARGYAFILDADDIAHKDLVGHIRSHPSPNGHSFPRGYMVTEDLSRGRVLGGYDIRKGRFHANTLFHNCGSSRCMRYDSGPGGDDMALAFEMIQTKHSMVDAKSLIVERPFRRLDLPAMAYVIMHGQNRYKGRSAPRRLSAEARAYVSAHFPAFEAAP